MNLPDAPGAGGELCALCPVGITFICIRTDLARSLRDAYPGQAGRRDLDVDAGANAASRCALALLAQVRAGCDGDLSRLKRVVKLTGFVNSTPDFTDQPKVINGASDLLVAVLGDKGRHARAAVSAAALPLGVAVEIEGIFEVE